MDLVLVPSPLSPRQREVAYLIGRGLSTRTIARELGISTSTAEAHIKLGSARLKGEGSPRQKLRLWALEHQGGDG